MRVKPFPTLNKSAADYFEIIKYKMWKISINDSMIIERVEIIVANGEIDLYEQFLLSPH